MNISSSSAKTDLAAFTLRLGLGAIMVAHALTKYFVYTLPGTASFFSSHGFPGFMAYPVFAMELFGGALLILGVGSRAVSLALLPVMIGALLVHAGNGWVFNAPNGGWEYPAFIILALIAQSLLGDGAFTLRARTTAAFEHAPSGATHR